MTDHDASRPRNDEIELQAETIADLDLSDETADDIRGGHCPAEDKKSVVVTH